MNNLKIYEYPYRKDAKNSDREILKSVEKYLSNKTRIGEQCSSLQSVGITNPIHRDSHGKPHIVGIDGIHVSVAHDKDLCLVAVSDCNIGIDLERADRKVKKPVSLAERYFCEDEINFLGENPTSEEFIDMWVKKEALSKLIGRGVSCMREKSVFTEDIVFEKTDGFDGYIVYCVRYK